MAIPKPNTGSAAPAPKPTPDSAPKNDAKKPQDNSAARQAPKETGTAVKNSFGDMPPYGHTTQPDNAAKAPASSNPKTAQESDPKTPPAAPDAKAAPTGPNAPVTDAKGQPVKTSDNMAVVNGKDGHLLVTDPATGAVSTDANGNPYNVTPDGQYLKTPDGKYVVYGPRGNPVVTGADGTYAADKNGNALAIGKDGSYLPNTVYDKNTGLRVPVDASGKVVTNADGKPLAVDDNGKIIQDAKGTQAVYNSKGAPVYPAGKSASGAEIFLNPKTGALETSKAGGPVFKIDPATSDIARDVNGHPLAVDDLGKQITTPDGKDVVYDQNNKLTFVDPASGKIAADINGNPYAITPDGQYARDANGNYIVHDKANSDNLVAIDGKAARAVSDSQGRPLALDENGNFLKTPEGNPVVYDKINGKSVAVSTDQAGNIYILDNKPLAIGQDGSLLKTPDGHVITYDKRGNAIPVNKDGKAFADQAGNTPALTREGNYLPGVVIDKSTGFRVQPDADGNIPRDSAGKIVAVDDNGNRILNEKGEPAVYDARGTPVFLDGNGSKGIIVYKDAATGELETHATNGSIYKVDPATRDLAKDESGQLRPPIYDPVNDDPTRPPVRPNQDRATTLANLPQGAERGDPMQIRNELFDEYGNLDVDKIYTAAAKYDPRDIYDAFINAGPSGGWDNLNVRLPAGVKAARPNEAQSREVIAALIAWQNENGKYNPLKLGKVPPVVFGTGGSKDLGGAAYFENIYINMDYPTGSIATSTFHEINHEMASMDFRDTYDRLRDEVLAHDEVVTEYLSNNWSGNGADTGYEKKTLSDGFPLLDKAVMKMGDGDRNKGLDILKRAYFTGDAAALQMLKDAFSPRSKF